MARPVSAIVLAAGDGDEMHSARPKPLHRLCGRPMVLYVLDALREITVDRAVIVMAPGVERGIHEVNSSIYCIRRSVLAPALRRLSPDNALGAYYLTDVVEVLHDAGYPVLSVAIADPAEIEGVDDRLQLAAAEAELRRRI